MPDIPAIAPLFRDPKGFGTFRHGSPEWASSILCTAYRRFRWSFGSQPCNPGMFLGTNNIDVKDWLNLCEWGSVPRNSWDPTLMLSKIIFYSKGTALKWYDIREAELTNWDVCKAMVLHFFGKPVGCQLHANKELACHEKKKVNGVAWHHARPSPTTKQEWAARSLAGAVMVICKGGHKIKRIKRAVHESYRRETFWPSACCPDS